MRRTMLAFLTAALLAPPHASAQMAEKGSYTACDGHVIKSTMCVQFGKDPSGENTSMIAIHEENDTGRLTYITLECRGTGRMAVYVQSKNMLLTQEDFDLEIMPKVSYRIDNGALKSLEVYPAHEFDANGEPVPDLAAVGLPGDVLGEIARAGKRIQIVIERNGFSKLTYSFPTYGLETSMKLIQFCNRM
ncbi:hypothetical protein ACFSR9_15320 [Deinococcus taklimakanensis]|uniref:Uncharacterized protein n=1 Tax=Deinococcus taklimakanensis TaxID=536443 RepID=A0ABW5P8L2_9DEIO